MNKKYICNHCKYASNILCNYEKHLKTKKHNKNIEGLIEDSKTTHKRLINESSKKTNILCRYCYKLQSSYSNRKRHELKCKQKIDELKNNIIPNNKFNINSTNLIDYVNNIKHVDNQPIIVVDNKNITNINNYDNRKTSVTTKTYLNNKCSKAGHTNYLNNYEYSKLSHKLKKKLLEDNKYDDDNIIPESDEEDNNTKETDNYIKDLNKEDNKLFVKDIFDYMDNDKLINTYVNFIKCYYKKDNIEEQSFHVTDSARKKFIYAKLKDGIGDIIEWVDDPQGIEVSNLIVEPILRYTEHQIEAYSIYLSKEIKEKKGLPNKTQTNDMLFISQFTINFRREYKTLKKQILEQLSSIFKFNNNLLEDK